MVGRLDEVCDLLELWALKSGGISKEVDGGGISNSEGGGKFSTRDIVEKLKTLVEESARLHVFCG